MIGVVNAFRFVSKYYRIKKAIDDFLMNGLDMILIILVPFTIIIIAIISGSFISSYKNKDHDWPIVIIGIGELG